MYKNASHAKKCNVLSTPQPGGGIFWISNESALINITIEGCWNISVSVQNSKTDNVMISIGIYNGATFIPAENYSWDNPQKGLTTFELCTNFTISEGDYLAFQIYNNDSSGTPGNVLTINPCDTVVRSPPTDPGFPVPELATIVLFGVGLLALVGYIQYRKRT